jgi:DNA-binding transcriptional regulator YiaG
MVWNGARIKALRKRFGDNQEEFADRIDVPVGTLRWWEQDQGEPPGIAMKYFDRLEADLKSQEPAHA